jgi:hypothetical protein
MKYAFIVLTALLLAVSFDLYTDFNMDRQEEKARHDKYCATFYNIDSNCVEK